MATYQELQAQLTELTERAEAARLAERGAALEQVRELVSTYALTEQEVFGRRRPTGKAAVRPKYHDPETGATWSGRGREPAWIAGKKRDPFLIQE